jgi:hypothetical protein
MCTSIVLACYMLATGKHSNRGLQLLFTHVLILLTVLNDLRVSLPLVELDPSLCGVGREVWDYSAEPHCPSVAATLHCL